MKQNLFSFSLSFFNTYNFPIFRNCRRKTVEVVLIFDEFQCSNSFLSFLQVSDLSDSAEISVFLSLTSVQKLKILLQISLTGNGILARGTCEPILRLFLLPPPSQVTPTWLTWTPFVQQTTDHRLRVAWPSFLYHFNGQS